MQNPDGTVTYTPVPDYNGADSFSYTISDGQLEATVTLTLQVSSVNDAPVAQADTAQMIQGDNLMLNLLANDVDVDTAHDQLKARITTQPAHGQIVVNTDGTVTYTPDVEFYGTDTFAYVANDGELDSSPALVTITIDPRNRPPVAADDAVSGDDSFPEATGAAPRSVAFRRASQRPRRRMTAVPTIQGLENAPIGRREVLDWVAEVAGFTHAATRVQNAQEARA